MSSKREFDIIIWGASGFTGRLVAEYIFNKYGVNKTVKWAMAGRNATKLEKVRAEMADDTVPLIIADSQDMATLDAMCQKAIVICTTVGPYAKYGNKLVEACINNKTHYCDLAGEVQWMRRMIDQHQDAAVAAGAKIVHTCGFDSIPSDMGVYFMQREITKKTGKPATSIDMLVKAMKGGMSGGTYASMSVMKEEAQKDKSIYKVLTNPYSLNPVGERSGPDKKDLAKEVYDKTSKSWLIPFVMAGINAAMGVVMMAKPGSLLKKGVDAMLPEPGEGPNKKERENGFYNLLFIGTLADGTKVRGKVTGDRDPGYGSTSKMLAESAICLALDDLPDMAGMLTPATAMGDALLNRLQENAGLTFTYKG